MSASYGRLQHLVHPPVSRVTQQSKISHFNKVGQVIGRHGRGRGYRGRGYVHSRGHGRGGRGGRGVRR